MFKSTNLKQIALLSSVLLTGFITAIVFLVIGFPADSLSILLLLLGIFMVIFISLFVILTQLVKNRIAPIYRMIKTSNSKKDTSKVLESSDLLGFAEKDVSFWVTKTQNEVESLKKLESYRRNYVGNVSHELKTPIFNIQGFIQTLLEGGLNDESILKNYLRRAAVNIDRLNTIVVDLDTITKLEAGELLLNMTTFDLQKLVKEVFEEANETAETKRIRLVFTPWIHEVYVEADRNAIHQVLTNLVVNSIKYGKPDGKTEVKFFEVQDDLLVEISDNGLGIDEGHIKHLFDRFYRVDKSRSRVEGGSGLGLSIVKHIIDAHNQQINVRSSIDDGSTFGFTLRRVRKG